MSTRINPNKNQHLVQIDRHQLRILYLEQNLSSREIAQTLSVSPTTIKRRLKEFNITKPKGYKRRKTDQKISKETLEYEYNVNNLSFKEIADKYKLNREHVSRVFNYYNLTKRKTGSRAGKPNKHDMKPRYDLVGCKYGNITVLSYDKKGYWSCSCSCGNTIRLPTGRITGQQVKSCGCLMSKTGNQHHLFKGYGQIPLSYYNKLTNGAGYRAIPFYVTIEEIWNLFLEQKGMCALSGLSISFNKPQTASLDRIDSSKPYELGNVQWLHKTINLIKWTLTQQEFIEYCNMVTTHQKSIT